MQLARGRTSLVHAIVWFAVSYGVAVLGYLLLNAAAGRWLGPDDFGYFIVVLTVTGVVANLGLVGSHRSGLREAARLRDDSAVEAVAQLRNGVRAVAFTTLPLSGALSGVGAWLLAGGLSGTQRVWFGVAVGLLVVLTGHQKLWANYLRGFGHVRFASLLEGRSGGALVALLQAALVAVAWLAFPQWGLVGALVAVSLGYLLPIALARRVVHRHWSHGEVRPRLFADLRHTIRRDWRFASVQMAVFLNSTVEIWLAAIILTSVETSMFTSGQRLAMLLVLPMTSLQVVFSPVIARLSVEDGHDRRHRTELLLRTGASLAFAGTMVIWVPMALFPDFILSTVFGPAFDAAAPALLLLSFGYLVNVLMGLAGLTLSMSGQEGIAARVQWAGAVLRPVVGTLAAVYAGVTGLAASAALISAGVFVAMWVQTRRYTGVSTHVTLRPSLRLLRRTAG